MALKLMIDTSFHPSASAEDKSQAKKKLETGFEHLMQVISGTPGGESLVEKARIKFKDRLYAIFKEAHATTNARKPGKRFRIKIIGVVKVSIYVGSK